MKKVSQKSVKSVSDSERATANEILSFAIATLQGKIEVSKRKARISTCLVLKRRLSEMGCWWQVKVLDHWIHRAQGGEFDDV